ncbi:MAG TPA: hypothetical protein VL400_02975 [Polyangiaceae bacterium]|nr:hypothetical protein [Polyangiaceae bacterium]
MASRARTLRAAAALVLFAAAGVQACAAGGGIGDACQSGSDCASGACEDGACVDLGTGGSGSGTGGDSSSDSTSGTGGASTTGTGGGSGTCTPNHDGTISRDEVFFVVGANAKYKAATDVTFDTSGVMEGGKQTWHLEQAFSGDHLTLVEAIDPTGAWYAADFPGATYAASLSESSDLLGVFEATDDALLLRGVVSPEDGLYKTELTYDPPVRILSFPLTESSTWSDDTTITGYTNGVFGVYYESYDSKIDARGDAITPFSTFDALRLHVTLTRTVGALVTVTQTMAFVTECFGSVATLTSGVDETGDEFSNVAEVRRLSP